MTQSGKRKTVVFAGTIYNHRPVDPIEDAVIRKAYKDGKVRFLGYCSPIEDFVSMPRIMGTKGGLLFATISLGNELFSKIWILNQV